VKAEKKRCPEKYAARFAGLPFTQINAPNFYPEKLEKKREEKAKSQASEINKELTESGQLGGGIEIENKFSNDDDEGNGKWEMATTMAMATSWPCLSYPACNWTILFLFIFVCCCAAHFVHLHFPFSISPVNVVQSNKRECECEWRQATGGADTCRGLSPSPVCPVLSCPILS